MIDELIKKAIEMRNKAIAPYSKYTVGSAILTESGKTFGGCNVESSSYGLTCCAERIAIYNAIANGHTKFTALAIATKNGGSPCGACRQVMAEYQEKQNKKIKILLHLNNDEVLIFSSVDDLLPLLFTNPNLKKF